MSIIAIEKIHERLKNYIDNLEVFNTRIQYICSIWYPHKNVKNANFHFFSLLQDKQIKVSELF